MPGAFPVYLRLPYRRDWFFCFKQETKRNHFLSILTDCVRHQNQGEVTSAKTVVGVPYPVATTTAPPVALTVLSSRQTS